MTEDLAAWLLEQIVTREQQAPFIHDLTCEKTYDWYTGDKAVCTCGAPQAVLAECDAKRRIIAEHVVFQPPPEIASPVSVTDCPTCGGTETCPTLRLLALPFADRDGYREEWAP